MTKPLSKTEYLALCQAENVGKPPKEQPEYLLQCQICEWLRLKYPNVFFMSDTIAAVKLTASQKVRNKAIQCAGFACPDILIFERRGGFAGLFIELKVASIYKKDGVSLLKNPHVENQVRTIETLLGRGYKAAFACSFDEAVKQIDDYFSEAGELQNEFLRS